MSNPFAKMGTDISATSRRGQHFCYQPDKTPARYIARVKNVKFLDGQGGQFYITEFEVIATDARLKDGRPRYRAGSSVAQVSKLRKDIIETVLGNIKSFCLAAVNSKADAAGRDRPPESIIDGDFTMATTGEKQPLKDAIVYVEAGHKFKKDKTDFTTVVYFAPEDVDKDNWLAPAAKAPGAAPMAEDKPAANDDSDDDDLF